jgi:hypothetical protein
MFNARALKLTAVRLALAAACLVAVGALAEPQHTPPWWNNDDRRTFRESYGFETTADPPDATPGITPPWYPHIGTLVESTGDVGRVSGVAGHQGAWGVQGSGKSGSVTFFVWNGEATDSEKHLWVQFDCYVYNGGVAGPSATAGPPAQSAGRASIPNRWEDIGGGWTRHWREWTIKPQPMWEEITFRMATAESGGTAVIDNVEIGTHCSGDEAKCDASGFDFATPEWTVPAFVCLAPEHGGYTWSQSGSVFVEWMPGLGDHEGVMGLLGGIPGEGMLTLTVDGLELPEEVVHLACQYDFFSAEGGAVHCMPELPPDVMLTNVRETFLDIGGGWQRCLLQLDVSPPPQWKAFTWVLSTNAAGDPVGLDNVLVSAGTVEPDDWYEDFEPYQAGESLHGLYGWKGWDGDPALAAQVASEQAFDSFHSVEIAGGADLVQEFAGFDDPTRWLFTARQYIPSSFVSGPPGQLAGTYVILLNTYADGGPHAESDWSAQMQFDSNDGMLKVYHGQGLETVAVPYQTDRWVEIRVLVDLPADWTSVYYDDELIVEYPWTAGVLGGGGGAARIAALDLFANGSSPVYYDDVRVWQAPRTGDVNCDGAVNAFDIDPFVLALTSADEYAAAFPACHRTVADVNGDGVVNAFDIDPFVQCLTGGGCAP